MAISMVRKPSETPNINNISDIIPFRYAYGGQNGYVKDKGRELDYTALGTQFTIGSGRVVLDGVESDIDSDGVIINIDSVSETRYYVVYYNVNLATNTSTIMSEYATGTYPTIEKGDDLTESPEGGANLVLYRFTATSGIISNVEKVVNAIEYGGTALNGYDISQGTIEQRLDNLGERLEVLGFKLGSTTTGEFTWSSTAQNRFDTEQSYINGYRQGNYVILEIYLKPLSKGQWSNIFSLFTTLIQWNSTEIYRIFGPKNNQEIEFNILATFYGSVYSLGGTRQGRWEMGTSGRVASGGVTIAGFGANDAIRYSVNAVDSLEFNKIQIGYEANPL